MAAGPAPFAAVYRCLRSSPALEGYHQHLVNAISVNAKHSSTEWLDLLRQRFDYFWCVRALRRAGWYGQLQHNEPQVGGAGATAASAAAAAARAKASLRRKRNKRVASASRKKTRKGSLEKWKADDPEYDYDAAIAGATAA